MTVEELIDELRAMPQTAPVLVVIRKDGSGEPLYEYKTVEPVTVVYDLGEVQIQLDE